jgi:hypothetical protein
MKRGIILMALWAAALVGCSKEPVKAFDFKTVEEQRDISKANAEKTVTLYQQRSSRIQWLNTIVKADTTHSSVYRHGNGWIEMVYTTDGQKWFTCTLNETLVNQRTPVSRKPP